MSWNLTKKEVWLLVAIFILGLLLRLYPGRDHFLWIYDQARDAYRSRAVLVEKDLRILGPQTDYPGLSHGPINYYFYAPFYFLSKGDPNLPGLATIVFNLLGIIPLALLTQKLFDNKRLTLLSAFFYAISYELVEYSRWIFNLSLSIPLLIWSYLFLWQILTEKKNAFWAGLFLGLAIQGELYLLYLIPFFYGFLYAYKSKLQSWLKLHGGLILGVAPLILAEFKFNFTGTKIFITQFLASHVESIPADTAILRYINHMGATNKHVLGGLSYPMGLMIFILLVGFVLIKFNKFNLKIKRSTSFILILLFSHSILFTFHAPNKVFMNLPVSVPLIILAVFVIDYLWRQKQTALAWLMISFVVFFSSYQLYINTKNKTPFEGFNFIQTGMLFSQKLEIIDRMYELTHDEPFSLAVLGTPYGVQTVWASVFEQYSARRSVELPTWFGFRALGYPADQYFTKVDAPRSHHILLIESNQELISPYIRQQFMDQQNEATTLIKQIEFYGYIIELRESKIH